METILKIPQIEELCMKMDILIAEMENRANLSHKEPDLIPSNRLAKSLGLTEQTLSDWAKEGLFKKYKPKGKRKVFYSLLEVEEAIKNVYSL